MFIPVLVYRDFLSPMRQLRLFFLLITCLYLLPGKMLAQDSLVVKWQSAVNKISDKEYDITLRGIISKGWHMYAKADSEDGLEGLRLSIGDSMVPAADIQISGKNAEIADPLFEQHRKIVTTDSISLRYRYRLSGEAPASLRLSVAYEAAGLGQFIPEEAKLTVVFGHPNLGAVETRILIPSIDIRNPARVCGASTGVESTTASKGLVGIFLLGFLAGLVALLTPCVFPMIPLTVSFFTKKAQSRKAGIRNAMFYAFFILLIYVVLSLPFHFLDKLNPEILNNISTNVYLNLIFFIVFIVFALSFFGLFDITLPASLSGTADRKAGLGNIMGIFFMALTLAIVSFSCTGPILGSLLAGSLTASGGAIQLTAGMAGFGLALALPFGLFALFPHWLSSLPKSGGWLNTVKVVLGFAELALALKFLSNADLVKHWGLLKREVFIGLWIIIGAGLTLYLLGLIRFKHDSPVKKLSPVRIGLAVLTGLFTLYLVPGVTNSRLANLTLISGFPPPLYYSVYHQNAEFVLGLHGTRDYNKGLAMAKEENKPVLLDFTGYACVNCRRMEEKVWSRPDVYALMKEKFIVISLYVDDKQKLPADKRFVYTMKDGTQKEINTVGDLWATFETENFSNNAQPLYAILNTREELLTEPVGYTPSADEYLAWLQCGLKEFNK